MPRRAITARVVGSRLVIDSIAEAFTYELQVGDEAYAAKLSSAIAKVNDEFDDNEKQQAPAEPAKPAPKPFTSSAAKKEG